MLDFWLIIGRFQNSLSKSLQNCDVLDSEYIILLITFVVRVGLLTMSFIFIAISKMKERS